MATSIYLYPLALRQGTQSRLRSGSSPLCFNFQFIQSCLPLLLKTYLCILKVWSLDSFHYLLWFLFLLLSVLGQCFDDPLFELAFPFFAPCTLTTGLYCPYCAESQNPGRPFDASLLLLTYAYLLPTSLSLAKVSEHQTFRRWCIGWVHITLPQVYPDLDKIQSNKQIVPPICIHLAWHSLRYFADMSVIQCTILWS